MATLHHLQPERSKSHHSTERPNTLGNPHSHYTTKTCRPIHDTISNSFNIHYVVNKYSACLFSHRKSTDRYNLSNGKPTCLQCCALTHILFLLREKERGATLSCRREMNTLTGVDRALCGDYMRQKKHRTKLQNLNITGLLAYMLMKE